jgi:hypothetical protein
MSRMSFNVQQQSSYSTPYVFSPRFERATADANAFILVRRIHSRAKQSFSCNAFILVRRIHSHAIEATKAISNLWLASLTIEVLQTTPQDRMLPCSLGETGRAQAASGRRGRAPSKISRRVASSFAVAFGPSRIAAAAHPPRSHQGQTQAAVCCLLFGSLLPPHVT